METQVVVKVHEGLHARPATQFAKLAKEFNSALKIGRGDAWADAKSAVKLMLLGVKQDEQILLRADGEDECEAVDKLTQFLSNVSAIVQGVTAPDSHCGSDGSATAPRAFEHTAAARSADDADCPGALKGVPASEGLAFGSALAYVRDELVVDRQFVSEHEVADEAKRFTATLEFTLGAMLEPGDGTMGTEIIEAIADVARSDDYAGTIRELIATRWSAAAATLKCGQDLAFAFESMTDEYLRSRADDIRGLTREIVAVLLGKQQKSLRELDVPSIILAEELSAPDLARANLANILGIVCTSGSATSHVAIIARSHGIPAVLGLPIDKDRLRSVARVSIDGTTGEVWLDHSDAHEKELSRRIDAQREQQSALLAYRDVEPSTRDGRKILIAANMGSLSELDSALQAGAMGVGLFRTELLFMDHQRVPTEDEQYEVYAALAQRFHPWPVIIRTLDAGGDKPLPGIRFPKEENPFLGWRGIRMCLDCPEVFEPQLRALLRAAAHGNICVMLPMVDDVDEVRRTKAIIERIAAELTEAGVPFAVPKLGIMIETPAAVLTADLLAQEVAFFSIGTNDLTQYIMAVDRMNPSLASLYKTEHPAVIQAIKMVCDAAKRAHISVGVCGEAASRPNMIPVFVNLGVDELSMSPNSVLRAKKLVTEI
ncbi:phosphoenolpyruvate--protein phosphotransferase [Burkholderia cenocepacia]|nr:phosphoenolpyruvate--protein phosphotransferase [Burkholderia cenocepacia]ONV91894.1 phosphoenolpyruvate--protein phosphotransferase [Burkholderia cenocepacia]ONW05607.1 phosphoenolpyruvate--protein phosphotransferase [Burkholderia cenocepacia]ONW17294.1 phosphoenolpyruvate--protein phosphotransferase [Burkholderia cenocepacia]ONW44984.1 phosphoenolpyruvate--protein phosphotransferase [Burkholderia cenocepacia]